MRRISLIVTNSPVEPSATGIKMKSRGKLNQAIKMLIKLAQNLKENLQKYLCANQAYFLCGLFSSIYSVRLPLAQPERCARVDG